MRATTRDAATRAYQGASRATLSEADDTKLLQEGKHRMLHSEKRDGVERMQPYGLTSVPKKRDTKTKKAAEAVVVYINGSRDHAIAVVIDDRRYRLMKLKEGEVALYDDLGHQVHLTRDGIILSAPKGKKIVSQIMSGEERPKDQQAQGATADMGQVAQSSQQVFASFTIDKDRFLLKHPAEVSLEVGGSKVKLTPSGVETTGQTISEVASTRFETIGPTHIGLGAKGESGELIETVGGTAEKAFAKV